VNRAIAPANVAKGVRHGPNDMRIVVSFDDETFAVIRKRAIQRGTSFAEQVRQLVEWGLEADE
jgi:hypothetical protein